MTLKQKWKDFQEARKEKNFAERDITVTSMTFQDEVCINNIVVIISSDTTLGFCEHFNRNRICDDKKCSMCGKNARYVLAYKNYKQKRSEFFNTLFHGREK